MVADAAQHTRQCRDVAGAEGQQQQLAYEFDVTGQDALQKRAPRGGEGHRGAAFVINGGGPGDKTYLLQSPGLIGESAATIDDLIGKVGHALLTVGRAAKLGENFKLHVAQVAVGTQLLFNSVAEEAADLHQDEIGGKLFGVQGCNLIHIGEPTTIRRFSQKNTLR